MLASDGDAWQDGVMRWAWICALVAGCQRLEVDDTNGDGAEEDVVADASTGDEGVEDEDDDDDPPPISEVPGCAGSPAAQNPKDGSHARCDGMACGCDEVCMRRVDQSGCTQDGRSTSCVPIPPQCSGLDDAAASTCMVATVCGEEFTADQYKAGVLFCSSPAGDCGMGDT